MKTIHFKDLRAFMLHLTQVIKSKPEEAKEPCQVTLDNEVKEDFVKYQGEAGCRTQGAIKLEGKEYVVRDGDVMHFKFNV